MNGSLDVLLESGSNESPTFRVLFIPMTAREDGAVRRQRVVHGLDGLRSYLDSIINARVPADRRKRMLDDWMLEVRSRGSLILPSIEITEQQAEDLLVR